MNIEELERLIANDENVHLELKKTTGELKDGMHTACAFLNGAGGWLVFGVAPKSLKILGQEVTDNTQREIAQALSGLEPAVAIGSFPWHEQTGVYRQPEGGRQFLPTP